MNFTSPSVPSRATRCWVAVRLRTSACTVTFATRNIGQPRQRGDDPRVAHAHGSGGAQHHVLPDAGVAVADRGNPIPALAAKEGGAVERAVRAVAARARLHGFLVPDPEMRLRPEMHRQDVGAAGRQRRGGVELAPDEGAVDLAQLLAVEPDLRVVVDAVEGQVDRAALPLRRRVEGDAIPPRLFRQVGDQQVIEAVQRVGVNPLLHQGGEHRARHGRIQPGAGVEGRAGDLRRRRGNRGGVGQFPAPVEDEPPVRRQRGQRVRRELRHARDRHRRHGLGKGVRVLRRQVAAAAEFLPAVVGRRSGGRGLEAQRVQRGGREPAPARRFQPAASALAEMVKWAIRPAKQPPSFHAGGGAMSGCMADSLSVVAWLATGLPST